MAEFMNEYKEKNKAKRVQMTLKPEIVEELDRLADEWEQLVLAWLLYLLSCVYLMMSLSF